MIPANCDSDEPNATLTRLIIKQPIATDPLTAVTV